ncbi:dephospho-CoA kinase [Arthrobacter sp. B0490]|uniref:dephospho-CoA kinase n=1 Tax=Arthrobacter sp. B0490 TaxID=2058891 RepID=UPI0015E31435|nr:dephospho-CoA kinase [Arthrobacter sp. B0490]
MLRVGLTGGIAAGKSVVARRLADLGAVVVDADLLAREAVAPGSPGLAEVVSAFGPGVLGTDGALDRPALGALVFADASARERLNGIVHPRVRALAAAIVDGAPEDAVVVEDIPLLVETGQAARFHLVVVVDAPDEERIGRMVRDRGMDPGDARRRIAAQASRDDRLREADAVLANDRTLDDLLDATDALWHRRIVPFRDNLSAGVPAAEPTGPLAAGLAGTSGPGRRIRAKLAAALPSGASVEPGSDPDGGPDGDMGPTGVQVSLAADADAEAVTAALVLAGYPRVRGGRRAGDGPGEGAAAVHRAADPAVDATVTVVAAPPFG